MSFSGRIRSPFAVTGLVIVAVGLSVWGLRSARLLEGFETAAYDWFIRLRPTATASDPRVTLVTITEADIQDQGGWPLSDEVIARTLDTLLRYDPRAVGLDIYRDIPVPPGTNKLNVTFKDPRIVVVTKFAEGASPGVRPPAVLRGTEQVGFNDIVVDPGGTVRRGLIFLDDGRTTLFSFALRLALPYLQAEGVTPRADPSDPRYLRLGRVTIRPLEPNAGGYVAADSRGYQFLLDFRDGPGLFPSVNLTALLSGRADPRLIRGKIVLIGIVAESIKDDFYTPYSGGFEVEQRHVPGVAIHATIASQLLRIGLDGIAPMATPSEATKVIWIFLWSALGGMVGFRLRSPVRLALAASGGLLALGLGDFVLFLRGWWIPLVPPALTWLLSATAITAYLSHQETLERAALMRLFSRHVSKEVAEAMWQQRDQFVDGHRPRPQGLIATALFTDLTGYSTVSETLSPDLLMEWLNEYMEAMAGQVSAHGGVIKQYAGDSIVAIFGVPVARHSEREIAQDAINAVNTALAMETALRELNRRWREQHRPTTGMRVGIFTGPAVAGMLGSAERSEYVVVGDSVNTAARLEQFDKGLFAPDPDVNPCRILIGETTLRYLGDQFETDRVGDFALRGKEHKVGVYRVIARSRADRPALTQEVQR